MTLLGYEIAFSGWVLALRASVSSCEKADGGGLAAEWASLRDSRRADCAEGGVLECWSVGVFLVLSSLFLVGACTRLCGQECPRSFAQPLLNNRKPLPRLGLFNYLDDVGAANWQHGGLSGLDGSLSEFVSSNGWFFR